MPDNEVGMITVGTQKDTSQRAVDLAMKYDGVWAIIGLHPIHLFETRVDEEESSFKSRVRFLMLIFIKD